MNHSLNPGMNELKLCDMLNQLQMTNLNLINLHKNTGRGPGAPLSIWRQSGINIVMLRNDLTEISQHKVMNLFNFHQFYTIIVI